MVSETNKLNKKLNKKMNNLIEKINNRIYTINKIKQQKDAISKGLKIEWETDPKKMQFEKLRSYDGLKGMFGSEILRVEEYSTISHRYTDIFIGDIQSHMEMIDIIMNGEKLIPPIASEGYAIVDGQEKMVRPAGISDGYHRLNLAKYFGLDTIPVVVFKTYEGYWFTPEKWSFEGPVIRDVTDHGYTQFGGVRATSIDGKVFTFREHPTFIDDSNTEYVAVVEPK